MKLELSCAFNASSASYAPMFSLARLETAPPNPASSTPDSTTSLLGDIGEKAAKESCALTSQWPTQQRKNCPRPNPSHSPSTPSSNAKQSTTAAGTPTQYEDTRLSLAFLSATISLAS